ncbi:ankyrin repeat and zinc finger domain-containing protein 1 [Pimephales promelas]|uniref:ankyrin repeat and zinc finger domain-containing protein 1 n=1 Tax=Pimephales promelas TaxID=90988 RepID=UPI00195591ED|nr:ankyrin repeat and zinc finger domain-containing protein 1 [Pimephales promelas]XP_039539182.1 ankyrin repeat and zinc finger domain-containing protein 1 [Pimephales promelas]KAG1945649.1 ankyrin repeat and zinc finger domain-containing protein [Pimephales promelas]
MAFPELRSVFSLCADQTVTAGLRELSGLLSNPEPPQPSAAKTSSEDAGAGRTVSVGEVSERMFCLACQCRFESREEQMEHYKLDYHRFNLRQRLEGRSAVTVEEFEKKTGTGDISSISGSDSDSEDEDLYEEPGDEVVSEEKDSALDTDQSPSRCSTKIVFQNMQGQYLSLYRCVLQSKRDNEEDLVSSLLKISNNTIWVILMTGGGHFAGAVFKGKEILQHKTFHRYTVRAKRGTAQGLRDSQNRSHVPKSAGAALRRYNETALHKDIHDLLESWAEYLKETSAIFLRAPSYNKTIFFGGRGAPLDKKDQRVRVLPFATRRATFREVQRVFDLLSTLHVYQKDTEISSILGPSKRVLKKKTPKPVNHPIPNTNEEEEGEVESSGNEDSGTLEMVEVTLGTLDLREHEIQPNKKKRRKRKEKREESSNRDVSAEKTEDETVEEGELEGEGDSKETQRKSRSRRKPKGKKHQQEEDKVDESWEYSLRDALYTACKTGDIQSLRFLLQLPEDQEEDKDGERKTDENPTSRVLCLLNKPIDSAGFTLLHVASAAGQKSVINLLMDAGSDPANKDKKGQTPYVVAPDKDTRNTFRKYMAEHPHKYDYTKAQVPGPLTEEIESKKAEKKKAQKAARKQREKAQKEEKLQKQQEEEEKRRFTALSDREKRALAAERRLAEHVATTGVTLTTIRRCFQCGESLLGKIPFEYLDYSFCTPRCVQAHRKANLAARP